MSVEASNIERAAIQHELQNEVCEFLRGLEVALPCCAIPKSQGDAQVQQQASVPLPSNKKQAAYLGTLNSDEVFPAFTTAKSLQRR